MTQYMFFFFLLILYTKQEKKGADVSSGVCERRDYFSLTYGKAQL